MPKCTLILNSKLYHFMFCKKKNDNSTGNHIKKKKKELENKRIDFVAVKSPPIKGHTTYNKITGRFVYQKSSWIIEQRKTSKVSSGFWMCAWGLDWHPQREMFHSSFKPKRVCGRSNVAFRPKLHLLSSLLRMRSFTSKRIGTETAQGGKRNAVPFTQNSRLVIGSTFPFWKNTTSEATRQISNEATSVYVIINVVIETQVSRRFLRGRGGVRGSFARLASWRRRWWRRRTLPRLKFCRVFAEF